MTTQNRTQKELKMKTKVNNDKEVIMTTPNRTHKELVMDKKSVIKIEKLSPFGGDYFFPKVGNKIFIKVMLRDCRHLRNGCDYEIIRYRNGGLDVFPLKGDWKKDGEIKEIINSNDYEEVK